MENQAAVARSVLEEMQRNGEIRYHNGQFWQWNGSCFQRLEEKDVYMYIADNVKDSMLVRTHSGYSAVVSIMENMCASELIQSEERGINFANGFVGEDLKLVDHDPKYGATFTLPFEYKPGERCPRWMEFLHSCWGDEPDFAERVMALQEMFAATLFKIAPRYQKAFLLYGKAGTGKTQILKVLRSMLPEDAVADVGPQFWGERFTMTDLVAKAANICGELPESGRISGSVFKQVVEGSPIRTEFKNKDGFVFTPECAHWFASNFLPSSADSSMGFIRRWLILHFDKVVKAEDRIDNLAEILVAEEREAIAAWALDGLRRLLDQRGYTEPQCHRDQIQIVRRINNSVHAFLENNKVLTFGEGQTKADEVYSEYIFHMRDYKRSKPVSFDRFLQMVEDLDLGVARDQLGDYVITGLLKNR